MYEGPKKLIFGFQDGLDSKSIDIFRDGLWLSNLARVQWSLAFFGITTQEDNFIKFYHVF